jgi:hypothetical protein
VATLRVGGVPAAFYGDQVKLSFIDRAKTEGSLRYKVCVTEIRRRCHARTFYGTASATTWDTLTVRVTQNLRPMIVQWYVGQTARLGHDRADPRRVSSAFSDVSG